MVRFRRWMSSNTPSNANTNTNGKTLNIRFFSYETLRIATNNFSTFLGDGVQGSVFKGVLQDDGRAIAVKRLHNPEQDRLLDTVEFMSHFRHKNLIQLIGCCVENDKQLLVYRYMENGSVSQLLHIKKSSALNWEKRAAVCIGVARGLSYLHEETDPRVIHCDIKPSNILVDANFVPKIADFDLYNLVSEAGDSTNHTSVKGTPGYLDPDYISTGQLTEKVDVYSFGVTMLEIITGRRVVEMSCRDDGMILDWVMRVRKEGTVLKIVDPKLTNFPKEDVERFINVALLCTQASSDKRPSMFRVVHMLYGGHKSDMEISDMASAVFAAPPIQWFSGNNTHTCARMGGTSGSAALKEVADEASCEEDVVREFFERSMEKIMRFQAAAHSASNRATNTTSQTMVIRKSTQRVFMEAVYPPFQSGEYTRRSSQL